MARRGWLSGSVALALAGLACAIPSAASAQADKSKVLADGPEEVTVGLYLNNIQDFNQENNTFYADFFMWMRWRGADDPSSTFEITNNIERWGLTQNATYEEPKILPSGEKLQSFRVQGRFFEPLDLIDYPLDEQRLTINIEDTAATANRRIYVADTEESGTDPGAVLPGWRITGDDISVEDHLYATDFGEEASGTAKRTYSSATFGLAIERPETFFAWKLMLPLIIVVLLGGSILLVHPSLVEVRIAASATALLSMVFLQQGYSDTLPQIGSLVLLDKIYALAYGLIIFLMVAVIYTAYRVRKGEDEERLAKLDRRLAVGALSAFAGGSVVLVLLNLA